MKKPVWIVSGVVIVFFALFLLNRFSETGPGVDALNIAKVSRSDLRLTVAATGVVTPDAEVAVKSKAGGEIISFPFEEGATLKKGDVVVMLDPDIELSKVNQAKASLLTARAKLEKARINLKEIEIRLKRQTSLFENEVISKQEMDNIMIAHEKAGSDVKIAEAEVILAKETLKEAEDLLRDTKIKAPLDGTILKKYVEEGQVISSTLSSASEGTLLFTMANLDKMYIRAIVDEADIGKVSAGKEVRIVADSYPDRVFQGHVGRIAPKGHVESSITTFDVAIKIDDRDRSLLKPVMTANVEILTGVRKNVLLVPAESVRSREGERGVFRMSGSSPEWAPVKTGKSNGIFTEVLEGLEEGDEVVISGMSYVSEGSGSSGDYRKNLGLSPRSK